MRITRVYHPGELSDELILSESASHHLSKVLRITVGDSCHVFDGEGHEASYEIASISKRSIAAKKVSDIENDTESSVSIHLIQSIVKGDNMDLIIQKAVELGVTEITPVLTEYCNVKNDQNKLAKKMQHWQAVMISACEQCGRAVLPKLNDVVDFASYIDSRLRGNDKASVGDDKENVGDDREVVSNDETKLIFHPASDKKLIDVPKNGRYVIAVGPEGGFNKNEIALAEQHGFESYSLGKRILRAETAVISAIATLQALFD